MTYQADSPGRITNEENVQHMQQNGEIDNYDPVRVRARTGEPAEFCNLAREGWIMIGRGGCGGREGNSIFESFKKASQSEVLNQNNKFAHAKLQFGIFHILHLLWFESELMYVQK